MISRLQAEVERLRSLLTCTESEAQQTSGESFGVMRKESDGQIAAIEGKIQEQQISLARRDNIDMPAEVQSNLRLDIGIRASSFSDHVLGGYDAELAAFVPLLFVGEIPYAATIRGQ